MLKFRPILNLQEMKIINGKSGGEQWRPLVGKVEIVAAYYWAIGFFKISIGRDFALSRQIRSYSQQKYLQPVHNVHMKL